MPPIAVIDFETTGLSPDMGDRATEVAIVLVEGDQIVDRFHSLMNAGVRISPFIEAYTGISNAMVAAAPMVAHNASFDRRFWVAELARVGHAAPQPFACTLLLSRRLYPEAPNHKLGSLAAFHGLPSSGRAHRALADAEMAAALLGCIQRDLCQRFAVAQAHHALLLRVQQAQRQAVPAAVRRYLEAA